MMLFDFFSGETGSCEILHDLSLVVCFPRTNAKRRIIVGVVFSKDKFVCSFSLNFLVLNQGINKRCKQQTKQSKATRFGCLA